MIAKGNRSRTARWSSRALAIAVFVAFVALTTPALASAAKPKPCPAGTGERVVGKKRQCVALAQLLPVAPGEGGAAATPRAVSVAQQGLLNALEHRFERPPFLPARVAARYRRPDRRVEPQADPRGIALARRLAALVGAPAAARALAGAGGVSVTAPEPRVSVSRNRATASGEYTMRDAASGVTTRVGIGTTVDRDDAGVPIADSAEMQFGVEFESRAGGRASFSIQLKMNDRLTLKSPCPTAAGEVAADGKSSISWSESQAGTAFGIDFIRMRYRLNGEESYRGQVGVDARLESVEYSFRRRLVVDRDASFLKGLIRQNWTLTILVDAAGRLGGASGRVSAGDVRISFLVRDRGGTSVEARARAQLEGDQELRRRLEQEAADAIERGFKMLKGAEEGWQKPNACVTMTLDPQSAKLAPGKAKPVSGRVTAKNGGGEAESAWDAATVRRGSVSSGLPGASSAGGAVQFETLADAPDTAGKTVDLHLRTTSRAGVAEGDWNALVAEYTISFSGQATEEQTPRTALRGSASATVDLRHDPTVAATYFLRGESRLTYSGLSSFLIPPVTCPGATFDFLGPEAVLRLGGQFEQGAGGPVLVLFLVTSRIAGAFSDDCDPSDGGTIPPDVGDLGDLFLPGVCGAVCPLVLRVPAAGGAASHSWSDPVLVDAGSFTVTATPRAE